MSEVYDWLLGASASARVSGGRPRSRKSSNNYGIRSLLTSYDMIAFGLSMSCLMLAFIVMYAVIKKRYNV
jgi:hypothetical protein